MIDTKTPLSDGWWMARLYLLLREQAKHCEDMHKRYRGDAPVPNVSKACSEAVKGFIRKSRTNFERLVVGTVLPRLDIVAIRTPDQPDGDGDQEFWTEWVTAGMPLVLADTLKNRLAMSQGLVIVGQRKDGSIRATAEDPRQVIAVCDPADTDKVIAGLKLYYDDVAGEDVAYLYMPGRVRVATSKRNARPPKSGKTITAVFSPQSMVWDDDEVDDDGNVIREGRSGEIPELVIERDDDGTIVDGWVPVVPFENEDGMAEFEPHLDLLDRITQTILQEMTVITFQAFKQRAIKGLPEKDEHGNVIDYSGIFAADPNAIWQVPAVAEFWESGNVDLTPIFTAIRDMIRDLAAVSFTPLYSITPDAANGSAEGASLRREGLVFKCEGHQRRMTPGWAWVVNLMALLLGREMVGAQPVWVPAERFSLAERGSAAAQLKDILPIEAIWLDVLQVAPERIASLKSQRAEDLVYAQQLALIQAQAKAQAPVAAAA